MAKLNNIDFTERQKATIRLALDVLIVMSENSVQNDFVCISDGIRYSWNVGDAFAARDLMKYFEPR